MEDNIKIVKSLEDSGLLLKRITETVWNEVKEQKGGFLSMLWNKLGASLLGNILSGRDMNRTAEGAIAKRQDRGIVGTGYGNKEGQKTIKWIFNTTFSFN